jgi:hypothetical protein
MYLGQDLFALGYVDGIPEITETKGFGRGKLSPSDMTIEVNNTDDQFSVDNPLSFCSGRAWQFQPLQAYDEDGILFADCLVVDITRNHQSKKASLICRDVMFQNRKSGIAYTSSDWETPANAAYNLMAQEGFTGFDATSIQTSISRLTAAACYIKCNILITDGLTLFTALEKLAQYAAADVYMYKNKVYFQHWKAYTGGVAVDFDYSIGSKCPRTSPTVATMESTFFNDYSIGYDGDLKVPATDTANNNIGAVSRARFGAQAYPEMRCDSSTVSQIAFKDKASAVYIGETYIRRGHSTLTPNPKILQAITFDVEYGYKKNIELGTYFTMTFAEEGWDQKVFEVAGIKRSLDKQNIGVEAWEIVL